MAINKVVFGQDVLIDLTGDDVTPETLLEGTTAHARNGEQIVGTATGGGDDANAVHYTAETKTEAQKAQARKNIDVVREIHNYDFGGKRLNSIMNAAEFAAAIAADDWSNIKVGDYWEIALNGNYHDWGDVRLPAGHTYYSDAALTTPAGTAASELVITPVLAQYGTVSVGGRTYYVPSWDCSGVVVTKGAKYYSSSNFATQVGTTTRSYAGTANSAGYISFQIGGTTYYAKPEDCHGARIKSLNSAVMKYEIGGINPYWRYGDSGALSGDVPHVVLIPRDCLPMSGRMRRGNKSASWSADQVAEILTANQAADGTRKSFTFTKSSSVSLPFAAQFFAGGVEVEMSSTEISGNTVTCAVGTAPASGATVTCKLLNINDAWHLTAAYHTLNDPDLGVLRLIKSALGATLAAKIYENTNGDGMRIYTDTKAGAGAAAVGGAFYNRGVLFMPTETEVWGAKIQSDALGNKFLAQLPIFAGSNRHRTKGIGNGASRSSWWFGSAVSNATNWCGCSTNGYPVTNSAGNTGGVAPSFILTA